MSPSSSRARPMSAVHRPSLTVGASTSGPLQLGVSQSAISTQQGEMTLTGLQEEVRSVVRWRMVESILNGEVSVACTE